MNKTKRTSGSGNTSSRNAATVSGQVSPAARMNYGNSNTTVSPSLRAMQERSAARQNVMSRGSFLKGASIAGAGVVAGMMGFGGIARAYTPPQTVPVQPGDDIQTAIDNAGDGGTVLFAPGTYRIVGEVSKGAILNITNSVTLAAANPPTGNLPSRGCSPNLNVTLNVVNTAFADLPLTVPPYTGMVPTIADRLQTECISVNIPNGAFVCKDLKIMENCDFHIVGANGSTFKNCHIELLNSFEGVDYPHEISHPEGVGLFYGIARKNVAVEPETISSVISGDHNISNCYIKAFLDGVMIMQDVYNSEFSINHGYTDFSNSHFIIEKNFITADGGGSIDLDFTAAIVLNSGSGRSTFDGSMRPLSGMYTIRDNTLQGSHPFWCLTLFGGNLELSNNDIDVNMLSNWGSRGSEAVSILFSTASNPTSYTLINNNKIHMSMNGPVKPGLPVRAFFFGWTLGGGTGAVSPELAVVSNVTISKNTIDGICPEMTNCIYLNNARNFTIQDNTFKGISPTEKRPVLKSIELTGDSFGNTFKGNDFSGIVAYGLNDKHVALCDPTMGGLEDNKLSDPKMATEPGQPNFDNALKFNETDFVKIVDSEKSTSTLYSTYDGSFTVAIWVKTFSDSLRNDAPFITNLDYNTTSDPDIKGWGIAKNWDTNGWQMGMSDGKSDGSHIVWLQGIGPGLTDGIWHHIAMVVDKNSNL